MELSGLGYLALVPLLVCPHGRCCCATISSHCYYLLVYYRNTRYFYNYLLLAYCPLETTQDRHVSHRNVYIHYRLPIVTSLTYSME